MRACKIVLQIGLGGRYRTFWKIFHFRAQIIPGQELCWETLGINDLFKHVAIHWRKPLAIAHNVFCADHDRLHCPVDIKGNIPDEDNEQLLHDGWEEILAPTQPSV